MSFSWCRATFKSTFQSARRAMATSHSFSLRNTSLALPPRRPDPSMVVHLTEAEDRLFSLLHECTSHLHALKPDQPSIECRVAGGWVRDKLLGLESADIDVALSTIMGLPFAESFIEYISSRGIEVSRIHLVQRNPDQSKHLETAKLSVLGFDLDFVNLRSETYAEDSRIPASIGFGTPLEDALRRDITINALFYNVHTRSVEDLTNKGLNDLRNGTIRTPLPPRETFLDDPLRILRCIRFASKFGYNIDSTTQQTIVQADVQEALRSKISRERVGIEIDKMFDGRDPLHAIRLIDESDLHPSVFWLPPSVERTLSASVGPRSLSLAAATILHHIAIAPILPLPEIHHSLTQEIKGSDRRDVRRRLWLAAALTPLRSLTYADKKKKHLAVEGVIREGLKFGNLNHFLTAVPALFNAADLLSLTAISPFVSPAINPSVAAKQRSDIGLLLRNKAVHQPASGTHWSYSITFALMQELIKLWDAETDTMSSEANKCIQIFNDFAQRIDELGLAVSIDEKPRLDGRDIAAILGIKPGPQTGRILESVIEWQLQHPDGSKDACQKWVIETFGRDGAGLEGGKSRKVQEVDIVSGQSKRRRTSE